MNSNYFTQAALLERGWTKSMLKLLPAPMEKRNPYYKSGAPMKLWAESVVALVEKSAAWHEAKSKADKRKANAAKAIATKKARLEAEVDAALESATVERLSLLELRRAALCAKEEWRECHGVYVDYVDDESNPWAAPDYVITRWMVNFIRHNLVRYDDALALWKGKTGITEEYPRFKNGILAKIAEAYADEREIVEECRNQMI